MSSVPSPATITYEQIMALFLETREQMKETDRKFQETERFLKESAEKSRAENERFRAETERFLKEIEKTREKAREKDREEFNRLFAKLGNRIGELVAAMVEGGIVRLFRELGYSFTACSRRGMDFHAPALGIHGEIDLFLENGEFALLVEVKTNLSIDDVKDHVKRMEKFRIFADARNDKRRFIAAVGGGVIRDNVRKFALNQGMYVVQQSGENIEVIPPEGEPKVW